MKTTGKECLTFLLLEALGQIGIPSSPFPSISDQTVGATGIDRLLGGDDAVDGVNYVTVTGNHYPGAWCAGAMLNDGTCIGLRYSGPQAMGALFLVDPVTAAVSGLRPFDGVIIACAWQQAADGGPYIWVCCCG